MPEVGTPKQERELGDFTKEEWGKINELLNARPGEEASLLSAQETPNSLQILVDATIKESEAQILDKNKVEILCGNFVALSVGLKLYPNTTECLVKLQSYGLSAPEGSLIEVNQLNYPQWCSVWCSLSSSTKRVVVNLIFFAECQW